MFEIISFAYMLRIGYHKYIKIKNYRSTAILWKHSVVTY